MTTEESPEGDRAARMREQRRAAIVAAARQVFAERGYHNASINDVIERAKIARGTFYLYFEGKRAVFESLLDEALRELRARIRRIDLAPGAASPEAQLHESLVRVLGHVLENRDFTRLLLTLWLNPDVEVADTVDAFYDHVTALIAASLGHGQRLGLVRACDTSLAAAALLGSVRGIIGYLLEEGAKAAPADIERVVEELIGLALRGVGVPGQWAAPPDAIP